jgi:hypothetical protein
MKKGDCKKEKAFVFFGFYEKTKQYKGLFTDEE